MRLGQSLTIVQNLVVALAMAVLLFGLSFESRIHEPHGERSVPTVEFVSVASGHQNTVCHSFVSCNVIVADLPTAIPQSVGVNILLLWPVEGNRFSGRALEFDTPPPRARFL